MKELSLLSIELDDSIFMNPKEGTIIALYIDDVLIINLSKVGI